MIKTRKSALYMIVLLTMAVVMVGCGNTTAPGPEPGNRGDMQQDSEMMRQADEAARLSQAKPGVASADAVVTAPGVVLVGITLDNAAGGTTGDGTMGGGTTGGGTAGGNATGGTTGGMTGPGTTEGGTAMSQIERELEAEIPNRVEGIQRAHVTTDTDLAGRIRDIGQGVKQGRPLTDFRNEVADLMNRLQNAPGNMGR